MKLIVIVLCLLSERFLVHSVAHHRFHWFASYVGALHTKISVQNAYALIALVVIPPVLLTCFILCFVKSMLFGFVGLLLNIIIFYYCLGPRNPFYPTRSEMDQENSEFEVGNYFSQVNSQLFAVVFWYTLTGASGLLAYRLISLLQANPAVARVGQQITDYLEWIPARLALLLYLLVGNFQRGIHFFTQHLLAAPNKNNHLLYNGGLLAVRNSDEEFVALPQAEHLVEHALVVYLVLIAFFTLAAWL